MYNYFNELELSIENAIKENLAHLNGYKNNIVSYFQNGDKPVLYNESSDLMQITKISLSGEYETFELEGYSPYEVRINKIFTMPCSLTYIKSSETAKVDVINTFITSLNISIFNDLDLIKNINKDTKNVIVLEGSPIIKMNYNDNPEHITIAVRYGIAKINKK